MLKTETEARRSQCRHVEPVVQVSQAGMRITFHACSASDCMAWRTTVHTKIENREARPVGFCGRDASFPGVHEIYGYGTEPINLGEASLLATPDGSA
jgi:hypothetical protein